MIDYENIDDVLEALQNSQNADHDRREKVREINHFLNDADGQWEEGIWTRTGAGRPRYTFDMCNPVVSTIWAEMAQNDFDTRIKPAGGLANKDTAQLYDGIIRNIETMSDAANIYASAGKKMIATGFSAVRILQEWADNDAFEQDLFIREVQNAVDRVWFDMGAENPTMSDANFCWQLSAMTRAEYKEKFPDGDGRSISIDKNSDYYDYHKESIIVGEFLYKKPITKTLLLMNNGAIYEQSEAEQILDELAAQGITVERTRERETFEVWTRFMGGGSWLSEPAKTVFDYLPLVPMYGNFQIIENKVTYWGAVEHLMDAQRVYNYSESRKVEEVALAPRKKLMATRKQVGPDAATFQTMNTNSDPVQLYSIDPEAPPPFETGGPQINPGLSEVSQSAAQNVERSSGVFGINPQNNKGLQSGVALERLENRGQQGTYEYFKAVELTMNQVGRVIVHALPKLKDTTQQQRVMNEDGSFEMVTINETIIDEQTQQPVKLNDLSQGIYDVTVDIGPATKNRMEEANRGILEVAAIKPEILDFSMDVLLNNNQAPGMDQLAERARAQMIQAGLIPVEQLTEEEQQKLQAAQQAQQGQPDPMAQALAAQAHAETEKAQANTADILSKVEERNKRFELEVAKLEQKNQELEAKEVQGVISAQQNQEKIDNDQEQAMMKMMAQMQEQALANQQAMAQIMKTQAETYKLIREGTGADGMLVTGIGEAALQQAEILTETQKESNFTNS